VTATVQHPRLRLIVNRSHPLVVAMRAENDREWATSTLSVARLLDGLRVKWLEPR